MREAGVELRYVLTFVGLLVLTTLTWGLSFLSLGPWSIAIALAIATAKALLVALYFMHLAEQRTTNWLAFLVSVLMLVLLVGLATSDVATRAVREPQGRPGAGLE